MATYENLLVDKNDGVATITLNRPDQMNGFNLQLRTDLAAAVKEVNVDHSIRAVVLTGAGRVFSAGADLAETQPDDFDVRYLFRYEYTPIMTGIYEAPKPWISAVNGAAAGVASALAMVCDLTVMADDAYLYQAFQAIGLVPDGGATWHLAHTLGRKRAYELIISGEKVSAEKCLALGLCNRVVPAAELLEHARDWAAEIAAKSPLAVRYSKDVLRAAVEQDLRGTLVAEADAQYICINSDDAREGAMAFLEKRAPEWKGR